MNGFNYVEYLKRHFMVGQIDPWRSTDEGKKLYTLLVTVEMAMEECQAWSNQEFTRHDFINYLKVNDVLTFKNIEDLNNLQELRVEEKIERKPKGKRIISEEEKNRRKEQMKQINQKKTDQSLKTTLS